MGGGRGWWWVPVFLGLVILFAVPVAALDVDVQWRLESAPTVVTLEASDISQDGAILRGRLDDLGGETSVQVSFEWGLSPALGKGTAPETLQTPATFQASLKALNPGTTYYYRPKAVGNGTALGETLTFHTAPPALALDVLSQIWLYLAIAAVAGLMAYLLTTKLIGARRQNVAGFPTPRTGEVVASLGGLPTKVGSFRSLAGRGRGKALAGGHEAPLAAPTTTEVICPHCGTLLKREAVYCFGCGRGLAEVGELTERVERAKGTLEQNERDRDALFAVGAHLEAAGEEPEAIAILLHRLEEAAGEASSETAEGEGPTGPGTCPYCGTTLEPETGNCPECGRSALGQDEALEETVRRALETLELDENDTEALFALGSYLLLDGKAQQALDTLNRLTLLDPDYPGLWRVKALVFEKLGNRKAAESALAQAHRRSEDLGGNDE